MEEFDFSVPVNATIIFDDSDDETFEKKPSIEDLKTEKEELTNDSNAENSLISPESITSKTVTFVMPDTERTKFEFAKNVKSVTKIIENYALQEKPLDMPYLNKDDKNFGESNSGVTTTHNTNYKSDTRNNINSEQQKSKISTENKKSCMGKCTEELKKCEQIQKAIEKCVSDNKILFERRLNMDLNPTYKNNETVTYEKGPNELIPIDNDNGVPKQSTSSVANYSNYFASFNQTPSSSKMSPVKSQKENIETEKTNMINVEHNLPTHTIDKDQYNEVKTSRASLPQNNNVTNYLKGLLETVSEHVIYILISYQTYVKIYNNNLDLILIENAKNNFIRTRNHFFDLNYSTVLNIILPRNHDPTFVKNFVTSTISIGRSKSCNVSYEQIRPVYADMINWVQKRKEEIQNMNISKTSNQTILQELQKPLPTPSTNNAQRIAKHNPVSKKSSNQYTLPSGTYNLESTTSKEKSPLHKQNRPPPPYSAVLQLQNPVPQNKPPPLWSNNNQQHLGSLVQNGICYQSSRLGEQSSIPPTYLQQQNDHMQHYKKQTLSTNSEQNALQTINDRLHQIRNQATNMRSHPNYDKAQRVTPHQNATSYYSYPVKPAGQEQTPSSWLSSAFYPYTQNPQQYYQEYPSQNYNQHLQPEKTTPVESNRSSISRDSGFMSPLNFSTSNDLTLQQEQRSQPSATPLITHVTSLNPNVCLIKDGCCTVCGKVTKQKCVGCYKYYYCSPGCQFLDWKVHQLVCK